MDKTVLEVEFDLAQLAVRKGAAPDAALGVLQKHWGYELEKRDWHPGDPGDHGIPRIGAHEDKVYRALIAGQPDLARQLRELVDQLYEKTGGTWEGLDPYTIDQSVEDWKAKAMVELASHPMQAYLIGQMLATEAAINHRLASARRENRPAPNVGRAVLHRPVTAEDRRAIEFLEHHSMNELSAKFEEMKAELRNQLIGAAALGKNPREVARAMANTTRDYNLDFATIAVSETARAESAGRLQELLDQGFEWCEGSYAHDSRVCDRCVKLFNGKKYRIKDLIGQSNYGVKADDWGPFLPIHPRCVAAGSMVSTLRGALAVEDVRVGDFVLTHLGRFRRVDAVMSRHHSGSIFHVNGLRVTGNHPVLTPDGFRLASHLGERADVLGVDWQAAHHATLALNAYDAPAKRGEYRIFSRVLRALLGHSMPSAAIHFDDEHRVGERQVGVEDVDGELGHRLLAQVLQLAQHCGFPVRDFWLSLAPGGLAQLSLATQRATSHGGMSSVGLRAPLLGSHRTPLSHLSRALPAVRESAFTKPSRDGQATATSFTVKLIDRLASQMLRMPSPDLLVTRPELLPSVRSALIQDSTYSGMVYDLQVREDESFITQGVVIHNCRCVYVPAVE